jgi:hypothetical protein
MLMALSLVVLPSAGFCDDLEIPWPYFYGLDCSKFMEHASRYAELYDFFSSLTTPFRFASSEDPILQKTLHILHSAGVNAEATELDWRTALAVHRTPWGIKILGGDHQLGRVSRLVQQPVQGVRGELVLFDAANSGSVPAQVTHHPGKPAQLILTKRAAIDQISSPALTTHAVAHELKHIRARGLKGFRLYASGHLRNSSVRGYPRLNFEEFPCHIETALFAFRAKTQDALSIARYMLDLDALDDRLAASHSTFYLAMNRLYQITIVLADATRAGDTVPSEALVLDLNAEIREYFQPKSGTIELVQEIGRPYQLLRASFQ